MAFLAFSKFISFSALLAILLLLISFHLGAAAQPDIKPGTLTLILVQYQVKKVKKSSLFISLLFIGFREKTFPMWRRRLLACSHNRPDASLWPALEERKIINSRNLHPTIGDVAIVFSYVISFQWYKIISEDYI